MCSFLSHSAECHHLPHHPSPAPENPPEEEDSAIPLYKRDLWEHLKQVKAMSFTKIVKNCKRKTTTIEDLTDGVAGIKIGSSLSCSMKKMKISQDDQPTSALFPIPYHAPPAVQNFGKEIVVKNPSSPRPASMQPPAAPVAVSSTQEDFLAPTSRSFLK